MIPDRPSPSESSVPGETGASEVVVVDVVPLGVVVVAASGSAPSGGSVVVAGGSVVVAGGSVVVVAGGSVVVVAGGSVVVAGGSVVVVVGEVVVEVVVAGGVVVVAGVGAVPGMVTKATLDNTVVTSV
jgi:hypothetical protein